MVIEESIAEGIGRLHGILLGRNEVRVLYEEQIERTELLLASVYEIRKKKPFLNKDNNSVLRVNANAKIRTTIRNVTERSEQSLCRCVRLFVGVMSYIAHYFQPRAHVIKELYEKHLVTIDHNNNRNNRNNHNSDRNKKVIKVAMHLRRGDACGHAKNG